ncbi:hypothetical protein ACFVAJ_19055 [Agromyces sp. NPDC057679]|uniref:hypothetical protein n=1 Tax=Agromyces sp. NPDC057679 TaxID=3346207 RepID=UPI003672AFB3
MTGHYDPTIGTNRAENGQATFKVHTDSDVALHDLITGQDVDRFTGGSCGALAAELAARTGWPVVLIADGPAGPTGWVHAGVRTPAGRIVDVEGEHDADDWLERWAAMVDAYGEDHDGYDPDQVDIIDAAAWNSGDWEDEQVTAELGTDAARIAGLILQDLPTAPGYRVPAEAELLEKITNEEAETFTEGDCDVLATELAARTGWPVVLVADGPAGPVGWVHAGVQAPDGRIVDVEGWHHQDAWVDRWTMELQLRSKKRSAVAEIVPAEQWHDGNWKGAQAIAYVHDEARRIAEILTPAE